MDKQKIYDVNLVIGPDADVNKAIEDYLTMSGWKNNENCTIDYDIIFLEDDKIIYTAVVNCDKIKYRYNFTVK